MRIGRSVSSATWRRISRSDNQERAPGGAGASDHAQRLAHRACRCSTRWRLMRIRGASGCSRSARRTPTGDGKRARSCLSNLVIASEGLVRLEGNIIIRGRELDGLSAWDWLPALLPRFRGRKLMFSPRASGDCYGLRFGSPAAWMILRKILPIVSLPPPVNECLISSPGVVRR